MTHVLTKLGVLLAVPFGVAVLAAGSVISQQPPVAGPVSPETARAQRQAYSEGGLRAAAAVTGSYVLLQPEVEDPVRTLEGLVASSQLIAIGTVGDNASWLDASGKLITTNYDIAIERVIKNHGGAAKGSVVRMAVLGGRVSFPDGTVAEMRTPGVPLPAPDQRFLFFLGSLGEFGGTLTAQQLAGEGVLYLPVSGYQGLYLFGKNGRTIALGSRTPLAVTMARKTEPNIIGLVQTEVARQAR